MVDSIQSLTVAIVNVVWVVGAGIAVICFVAAGLLFLTAQGQPEKLKIARAAALWGVIGVIVMVVAFSIIRITCNSLGMVC
ncbi:MAG: hypothetical protein NT026_00595 [Candidatus Staskawiczbacteria bacterium]|nr:hypothetical protein [Candidatus Staskawiczbacteria bacterium]